MILLLTGCSGALTSMPVPVTSTPFTGTSSDTPTSELALPPTAIIFPTIAPHPTATLDTRLPPEQWQEWPVVPSVTGRAIEIYQAGLAMGNDPHAFSKAGDCQSVRAAFMGFYDTDRFNLGTDYQYLQQTIDNFAGYFNTDGQAVKGGFSAASILSPLRANPAICQPGENPLECELRITRPTIMFISFEVWWEGRTAESYEKYMRQVIETVIAHGAVPILATKADNVEGNHSINLTTARLAYEYDLPLWNFWLAVQSLPYHGMDPVRNDGFHISVDGWNQRSVTGLQALDSIWRGVRDAVSSGAILSTSTPEPTRSSNLLPVPAAGPSLASSTNPIVFGLISRQDGIYESQGVYLYDLSTRTVAQILAPGFNFQSASPDGKYLLVNQGNSLFRTDGSSLALITDQYFPSADEGAFWLPDGRIALILRKDGINSLVLMKADGSGLTTLAVDAAPMEIYPSTDGTHLTWESGACDSNGQCTLAGAWLTDLASGESQSLSGLSRPLVSPDGQALAYAFVPSENNSNLAFTYFNGAQPREYPLSGDILAEMAWQPGGSWLAVNMDVRNYASGIVTGSNNYLITPQDFTSRQLQSINLLNPNIIWSPDGAMLLWLGTDWRDTHYSIRLWKVDVASGQGVDISDTLGLVGSDYLFVNNAAWLARP